MAKPPATPPSSDIDGVDEDRRRIDDPRNDTANQAQTLQREEAEARGRPKDSRA